MKPACGKRRPVFAGRWERAGDFAAASGDGVSYFEDNRRRFQWVMYVNKRNKLWTYAVAVAIPLAVGALAGFLTWEGVTDFQTFAKSSLTPPGWVFPLVWTILYTLMGISLARIWMAPEGAERSRGLSLFLYQLIFNFFWSIFFFNMNAFGFSLLWILALLVLIGLMIRSFYRVDKSAALLQVPYFLWVTFATYLTYTVWKLNG